MRRVSPAAAVALTVVAAFEIARWLLHRPQQHAELAIVLASVEGGVIFWLVHTLHRSREEAELRSSAATAGRDAAEEADRTKQEFLARVTHEWRGPLSTMSNWVWQLERRSSDPQLVATAVAGLQRSVAAQRRMVSDLLDFSRGSSGKLSMELDRVTLRDVVAGAMETVAAAAAGKRIAVEMSTDSDDHVVCGDAIRLGQVFTNILDNAAKFTPHGGSIRISIRGRTNDLEIKISDTGVGIAPEALAEIFEPFSQTEAERDTRNGGLGLGLAIARQIVELHGGSLIASSGGPGRGSVFTVRLPQMHPGSLRSSVAAREA